MKKIFKILFLLFTVIMFLIFFYPLNTNALTKHISYAKINDIQNLEIDHLSFTNISFKDYSKTSAQSFGITGEVVNNSNGEIKYTSIIYFYDTNYNLIAQWSNSSKAVTGTSKFNQMANLDILEDYSVDDICYYDLSITLSNENEDIGLLLPSKDSQYCSYEYVIDKYDINIVVNENNTFDITENITAYFNIPKHGIFRTIPLKNNIARLDGSTSTNRAKITNISVDNEYTKSREMGNIKLKIGSPSRTLTGSQTYVIKYTYNIGKDPIKSYDELYYNIIGNEWDTVIGNITFSITMPKDFDSSKLGFSSGRLGSTENSNIEYVVSDNTITGSYNGILKDGEALTVRCELPDGYFVGAKNNINIMEYYMIFIPIIFLLISVLLWYIFGHDDQVIETVEFYPPDDLNSLDIGYLYKGSANVLDVTSLLIYLANKGYIEIIDLDTKTNNNPDLQLNEVQVQVNHGKNISNNSLKNGMLKKIANSLENINDKKYKFIIKKLKDYDGNNIYEQWFMKGLFNSGCTKVTDTMLYNKFYKTNYKIMDDINKKENKEKVFEKTASNKKAIIILMIIATYCFITIPPILNYGQPYAIFFALIFPGIGFSIAFISLFNIEIFGVLFGLICGGWTWCGFVLPSLKQDSLFLISYIIGIVCVALMFLCLKFLPKRTKYGNKMLGKIEGFKNFLELVEKEKLEALVMKNPNYFYDILPYTYVLGISDKWINKFESIALQAPSWYSSSREFKVSNFGTIINSTVSSVQSALTSSPTSSSSSGGSSHSSSGGGSSGGGSGGGGGGSW